MPNTDVAGVRPVDIHAHFFPQEYLDVLAEDGARFGVEYRAAEEGFYIKTDARFQGPLPYRAVDLKSRISDMDANGTAVQAMSLTGPMAHWGDEEVSHKLSRAWNDAASAAHLQYPTRLYGLLTLPMLFPDRAVDELNRASKLPGLRGVYMGTNINQRDLDDPLFEPIFARIEQLDLPVFLHPLTVAGGPRIAPFSLANLIGAHPASHRYSSWRTGWMSSGDGGETWLELAPATAIGGQDCCSGCLWSYPARCFLGD